MAAMDSESPTTIHRGERVAKGPIAWMAGHSVAANLMMFVFLVGGLIYAGQIKKEVFPDFELDYVTISVPYPGASPEEVERGVVLAIEEAVQGLDGIKEITATAREGSASVTVEIIEGKSIERLAQDIQSEVDRITSFPEEAEEPRVTIAQRKRSVVSLALYGAQGEKVLRETAEQVRDRLLQSPQITQVEFSGVRDYEIDISVPQAQLQGLRSDPGTDRRDDPPGGSGTARGGHQDRRWGCAGAHEERRDFGPEFGRIPIITSNEGTQVLLSDIARITDGFEDTDSYATYNGYPAILIEVYRVGDQTPIAVSEAVHEKLVEINADLPPQIFLDARNDRSDIYRQRMDLMLKNGYMGLALVFILLAVFLEPRLAFWVSLGIPISILGSLFFIPMAGVSINIISMFAFIITLGIVVDDAIVAGENMFHHRQKGASWFKAAVDGTREIATPVTFSVLTNLVAFAPLFFVSGFMGKVFRQIPVVVIAVFAISLIESLLILPAHIGHQRRSAPTTGLFGWLFRQQHRFSNWFSRHGANPVWPFSGSGVEKPLRCREPGDCLAAGHHQLRPEWANGV
jgi:multidrug efflux pump subunit AcrB